MPDSAAIRTDMQQHLQSNSFNVEDERGQQLLLFEYKKANWVQKTKDPNICLQLFKM